MEFGKLIRIKKDLSPGDLGDLVGLSQTEISEIESGKKDPSFPSAKKLCEALDLIFLADPEEL